MIRDVQSIAGINTTPAGFHDPGSGFSSALAPIRQTAPGLERFAFGQHGRRFARIGGKTDAATTAVRPVDEPLGGRTLRLPDVKNILFIMADQLRWD